MIFKNATQLKDWIKNKSKQTGTPANVLLQNYMMERFLERVSLSEYRKNVILKGGFLIAAMVGINLRNTMDIDTTIKGLPVSREQIERMIRDIIEIEIDDEISFEIQSIKNIRDVNEYDDFRIVLNAVFYTIRVNVQLDITTGDVIIPQEVEYHYKLMFEERTIPVMAYNLYTILAEKIETILSRNVMNSRGRDFYDVYILISLYKEILSRAALVHAIRIKAEERDSVNAIEGHIKHLKDIADSPEMKKIWSQYTKNYAYAKGIDFQSILEQIMWVFESQMRVL
jgi:predicted nucleotidyltransferase component of viral defense system